MIKPTIGRVVLVRKNPRQSDFYPALVCAVHNYRLINVGGFDDVGNPFSLTSIQLLQDDDVPQSPDYYARWMDYQITTAAKQEVSIPVIASDADPTESVNDPEVVTDPTEVTAEAVAETDDSVGEDPVDPVEVA